MDVLDRLTDKGTLEREYQQKAAELTVIDAVALAAKLKSKVVGQETVIDAIAQQLRRRFAARRKDKPIAVFCFAGPPGAGKTYLAKAMAEELYRKPNHLHFFDMSQFGQPHAAASLFGQARGYVGSTSYGSLTAALRDVPNSIVLLDEFEKAHPEVHKRFLTAWNDGFITEVSDGARISTNEAVFILTTNAASRRIGEMARDFSGPLDKLAPLLKAALGDERFAPEVLSRIDDVFAFRPLKGLDVARVVALEMEKLVEQYGLKIADGGIDPHILFDAIALHENSAIGGVRDIARAIERQITDQIIQARTEQVQTIRLVADGTTVRAESADAQQGKREIMGQRGLTKPPHTGPLSGSGIAVETATAPAQVVPRRFAS